MDAMKTLAITGGGQGIGRGIAFLFAQAGYAVSIIDADEKAGREACAHIESLGVQALFVRGDIARERDVENWLAETVDKLGCPDVLVNNAGIAANQPFLKLDPRDFDRVIGVNLRGTFLCAQAAARHMTKHRLRGAIINIASTRAFMSEPNTEAYSASKGGIVALTHAMAMSLASSRIRVNSISPGWIEVGDWQYSRRAKTPRHSRKDREQHPVGRVGVPDDIAEACLFLAEHAGFMTGQNMIVDGGMTVKMIYKE
jgi:NAD(P)-dependent dehydrogenase (short-subunit alcohol dehydrogenase family)